MKSLKGRSLNLGDGMILVAATAIGSPAASEQFHFLVGDGGRLANIWNWTAFLIVILPLWLSWTFGILIIRLRRPRPTIRHLCRQPGFVAAISGMSTATMLLSFQMLDGFRSDGMTWPCIVSLSFLNSREIGSTIFGAWILLAISRRWKSERGSIDRVGMLLGFGWILSWVGMKLFWLVTAVES